jgi:TonB family protein
MNKLTKSVIFGLSILGVTAVTAQAHPHDSTEAADQSGLQAPVPIKVIQPGVDASQVGQVVNVRFALDENGKPSHVESADAYPKDALLADRVIRALRSWEFEPARDENGNPVAVMVEMPIVIEAMTRG